MVVFCEGCSEYSLLVFLQLEENVAKLVYWRYLQLMRRRGAEAQIRMFSAGMKRTGVVTAVNLVC